MKGLVQYVIIVLIFAGCSNEKVYRNSLTTIILFDNGNYKFQALEEKYGLKFDTITNIGTFVKYGDSIEFNSNTYKWSTSIKVAESKDQSKDSVNLELYEINELDTLPLKFDVSAVEIDNGIIYSALNGFPLKFKPSLKYTYFILWYATGKCERKYFIKNSENNVYKIYMNSEADLMYKPFRLEYFEKEKAIVSENEISLFSNKLKLERTK